MGDVVEPMEGDETERWEKMERKISLQACNILNELRRTGELCDAVVKVDTGEQFPVHRAIMSACSPYFRALFTNGMYETKQKEVIIPGVSAEILNIIIEFAYTRDTQVTTENVEKLLPAADQFHVLGLVKACCTFLRDRLTPENCIGIRSFSNQYFCERLTYRVQRYVLHHFQEISEKSNELLQLKLEEFTEILRHDELNVKSEELVFETVLRWINYDPDNRKQHILPLLRCIRLGLLSSTYFVEKVKMHPYIRENEEECRETIIDTLKFLYELDSPTDKELDTSNPIARPRIPYEILFAIGGWSGGSPTNVIEAYDTRADRWIQCPWGDTGPRAYHGTVSTGGKIYIIGGFDGMEYFNSVRCFDPFSKGWTEAAPMNARRCYVSVAELGGQIYAMGGFDGHVRQNSAERFTPSRNQWSLTAPMNQQRSDASATALNGKIFIVGGFNGRECMSSGEYYCPEANQWTLIAPMRTRRSGVGIIAHRGAIYAIGGFNGMSRMNTGERWDPEKNVWSPIAEMYSPRSNYAIEVIDDMIFGIGGFNGVTTIFNVECYDDTVDEWYDATDMNIYRSALSACVVSGLTNVRDYIHKKRDNKQDRKKIGQNSQALQTAAPAPAPPAPAAV